MKKILFLLVVALVCATKVSAQSTKVADKELIGSWIMESMQWKGEKKVVCGKASGYTQFKYYGPDGEYACAQIYLTKEGNVVIAPHEYGTYTFKNGVYSEMGRPAVKADEMKLIDKTTFHGKWKERSDVWKKVNMPDKLVRYIVDRCRLGNGVADDMQKQMKQTMFK